MRNKRTVILAILVIIIWGTIGYSIYNSLSSSDDIEYALQRPVRKPEAKISKVDFPLSLNYPDPFKMQETSEAKPKSIVPVKIKPPRPAVKEQAPVILISWDKVQYLAAFFNASKNHTVATVLLEGAEYMVKEGDRVGDYTIICIARDSLLISYGAQQKYIRKNK